MTISPDPFFERLTDSAAMIIVLAEDEARRMRWNFVGSEMLLLGLVSEKSGIAAIALTESGITLTDARAAVDAINGYGSEPLTAKISYTPRAKKILRYADIESYQSEFQEIDSEHLLFGLIHEAEDNLNPVSGCVAQMFRSAGVAARALHGLGVDLAVLRAKVLDLLQSETIMIQKYKHYVEKQHTTAARHYRFCKNPLEECFRGTQIRFSDENRQNFTRQLEEELRREHLPLLKQALFKKFEFACKLADLLGTLRPDSPEDPEELFGSRS